MIVACVPQLARAFLARTPILNVLYNVNVGLEFCLLWTFFNGYIRSPLRRWIFYSTSIICVLAGIAFTTAFGLREKFLTEWLCINNLCYTAWILVILYDLYEDDRRIVEIKKSQLYYIVGLFFYASCTILIFALWDYIMTHRDSYIKNLWIIHDVFNVFMYTAFTMGFISESNTSEYLNAEEK